MDQASHTGPASSIDDLGGRGRIARLERRAGGDVDDPRDMHDNVGARRHLGKAVLVIERPRDPRHAVALGLRAAGEGADVPARRDRIAHRRTAHEAGRAGHREHAPVLILPGTGRGALSSTI